MSGTRKMLNDALDPIYLVISCWQGVPAGYYSDIARYSTFYGISIANAVFGRFGPLHATSGTFVLFEGRTNAVFWR